jgi:outer membrane protein, protease secretion system
MMRLNQLPIFFCALCASLILPLRAETIGPLQAYERAIGQDLSLRAAGAQAAAGREQLPQARAKLFPTVSLSMGRYQVDQDRQDAGGPTLEQRYISRSDGLTIRQPIVSFSARAELDRAQASVEGVEAEWESQRQRLAQRLADAYASVVLASARQLLVEAQSNSLESQLKASEMAFSAGSGTRTDIQEVASQLALVRVQLAQERQSFEQNRRDLADLLGMEDVHPWALDLERFNAKDFDPGELSSWLTKLFAQSLELRQRLAQRAASEAGVRLASASRAPLLEMVAQWAKTDGENGFFVSSKTESGAIGFQLTVPLFEGGAEFSRERQAVALLVEAQERLALARRQTESELRKAYFGLKDSIARVAALETAFASTQQLVLATQKSATAGVRSRLDVLAAQQRAAEVALQLAEARLRVMSGRVRLESLVAEAGPGIFERWQSVSTHSK